MIKKTLFFGLTSFFFCISSPVARSVAAQPPPNLRTQSLEDPLQFSPPLKNFQKDFESLFCPEQQGHYKEEFLGRVFDISQRHACSHIFSRLSSETKQLLTGMFQIASDLDARLKDFDENDGKDWDSFWSEESVAGCDQALQNHTPSPYSSQEKSIIQKSQEWLDAYVHNEPLKTSEDYLHLFSSFMPQSATFLTSLNNAFLTLLEIVLVDLANLEPLQIQAKAKLFRFPETLHLGLPLSYPSLPTLVLSRKDVCQKKETLAAIFSQLELPFGYLMIKDDPNAKSYLMERVTQTSLLWRDYTRNTPVPLEKEARFFLDPHNFPINLSHLGFPLIEDLGKFYKLLFPAIMLIIQDAGPTDSSSEYYFTEKDWIAPCLHNSIYQADPDLLNHTSLYPQVKTFWNHLLQITPQTASAPAQVLSESDHSYALPANAEPALLPAAQPNPENLVQEAMDVENADDNSSAGITDISVPSNITHLIDEALMEEIFSHDWATDNPLFPPQI